MDVFIAQCVVHCIYREDIFAYTLLD